MKKIALIILICLINSSVYTQRIGLDFLFQPNLTVGTSLIPKQDVGDTLTFGMNRFYTNLVVPLDGNLKVDLKNLNASFSQHFLTTNVGLRSPIGDITEKGTRIFNFSAGITGVYASIKKGIWFYTANAGIVQDIENLNDAKPFATGAVAWVQMRGLYKHNIFGVALLYQHKFFMPVPIIGFNRKYNKKWFLELLIPVQAAMRYKFSKKFRAGILIGMGSFKAGLNSSNNCLTNKKENLNYTEVKFTSVYEYKISRRFVAIGELGVSAFRKLSFCDELKATTTPYAGIAIQMDLKRSIISSRMFGNDM